MKSHDYFTGMKYHRHRVIVGGRAGTICWGTDASLSKEDQSLVNTLAIRQGIAKLEAKLAAEKANK